MTYLVPFVKSLLRGGTGSLSIKNILTDFKASVTFPYKWEMPNMAHLNPFDPSKFTFTHLKGLTRLCHAQRTKLNLYALCMVMILVL